MKKLKKLHYAWFIVAGVAILGSDAGIVYAVSRSNSSQAASPVASPAMTVTVTTPRRVTWPVTLDAWGPVAAWQEASVDAQVGGYDLRDVRVNVGDKVQRGQLLAQINAKQLEAQVAQLKATMAQAQANAAQASANRQRMVGLQDSGGISQQDVLQYVTQSDTARAQVDSARATLAEKELQLRDTEVRAPDSGTISSRSATLGAVVSVGQELFRLIREDRLEWRGELTAQQIGQVRPGQLLHVALPDGSMAEARVRQLAPALDATSRLGTVYADLIGASHARAGMYVSGQLVTSESQALVVPAASVVIRDGRSYVPVLRDHSAMPQVELRPVDVGRRAANQVEIVHGLTESSRVVVQGAGFLDDGNVVRVVAAGEGDRQ